MSEEEEYSEAREVTWPWTNESSPCFYCFALLGFLPKQQRSYNPFFSNWIAGWHLITAHTPPHTPPSPSPRDNLQTRSQTKATSKGTYSMFSTRRHGIHQHILWTHSTDEVFGRLVLNQIWSPTQSGIKKGFTTAPKADSRKTPWRYFHRSVWWPQRSDPFSHICRVTVTFFWLC